VVYVNRIHCGNRHSRPIRQTEFNSQRSKPGNTFDGISLRRHNCRVAWEVEVSDEFIEWYTALRIEERASIAAGVGLLEVYGPGLGRPQVDTLKGSTFPNMKELRVQHQGRPYRVMFAFDPRRNAYLILGGDKTGDKNWYIDAIRRADAIYSQHLREIGE
jgi:hypothetical protein